MKKVLIADLIKDVTDAYLEDRAIRIKELLDKYRITFSDASQIVDNYSNYETQDKIAKAMDLYSLTLDQAENFVKDHSNESEWAELEDAADTLGIDIIDVEDEDVESLNDIWDLGGSRENSYVEIDTSLGKAFIYYTIECGFCLLVLFDEGEPANYPISREEANSLSDAESFGIYFNQNMRNNDKYSDIPCAWGCKGPDSENPKRLMNSEDKAKLPQDLQDMV